MEVSQQPEQILSILGLEQREQYPIAWVGAQETGRAFPIPLSEAGSEIVRARLHPEKQPPSPRTGIAKRLAENPEPTTFTFGIRDGQLLAIIQCHNKLGPRQNRYVANTTRALPWAVQVKARLRANQSVLEKAGREYLPKRLQEGERREVVLETLIDRALKDNNEALFEYYTRSLQTLKEAQS